MNAKRHRRAALYVRVSTDRQTVENQVQALTRIADQRGWTIVATYRDHGVSGAKSRDERPGLKQLLTDASRARFDIVMVWAIDRLGRSLVDLLGTIKAFEEYGVDLLVERQSLDTTSPHGRLMFHIVGAFGEFERDLIKSRVHAGLRRARKAGTRLGRPPIDSDREAAVRKALARGDKGILKIAAETGTSSSVVQRIKAEMQSSP